jgi:PPOX class probable F420-dependent enzyme
MAEPLLRPEILADTRISDRLASEPVIWLTTVSADGRPHSVPVWFGWDDPVITVFSQPRTAKVRRLRSNPAVSVSLDTAVYGTDVVTGEGDARLVDRGPRRRGLPMSRSARLIRSTGKRRRLTATTMTVKERSSCLSSW